MKKHIVFSLLVSLCCVSCSNSLLSSKPLILIDKYFYAPVYFNQLLNRQLSEGEIKSDLKKYYKSICTMPLLNDLNTWIEQQYLQGDAFALYFNEILSYQISKKEIEYLKDSVVVRLYAEKEQYFSFEENLSEISTFIKDYKITNYSQQQIMKIIKREKNPELIELRVKSKVKTEFTIVKVKYEYKISNINEDVLESKLTIDLPGNHK